MTVQVMSSPGAGATWTALPGPDGSGVVLPVAAFVHDQDCE